MAANFSAGPRFLIRFEYMRTKLLFAIPLLLSFCARSDVLKDSKLVDMNRDQRPDRVSMDHEDRVWVEIAQGESFAPPVLWWKPDAKIEHDFWLADVTGDGVPDLVLRSLAGDILVAEAKPDGFAPSSVWLKDAPKTPASGVVFEDINHDGKMDLVLKLDGGDDSYTASAKRFEYRPERSRRK